MTNLKVVYWERLSQMMGATLPRGIGVVYAHAASDNVLVAVVPLNLIIRVGIDVYRRLDHLIRGDNSWIAAKINAAYHRGRLDGLAAAYIQRLKDMAEKTHVVHIGDSLRLIALKYYGPGSQDRWRAIWQANKAVIGENPYIIRAGQVLTIPDDPGSVPESDPGTAAGNSA